MKNVGERFGVAHTLFDANGLAIDTECHVHVFVNKVQTQVLTRADGDVTYDPETSKYSADFEFATPTLAQFVFHFPVIHHTHTKFEEAIDGPVLVEPV